MKYIDLIEMILIETENIDVIEGKIENLFMMNDEQSYVLPLKRLFMAYKDVNNVDFCGHLRQCLVYYKDRVRVSNRIYNILFSYKNRFGFEFSGNQNQRYVNISNKIFTEIPDLSSKFTYEDRRIVNTSISDGRMYRYYGYETYTSLAQKMLNYLIANLSGNETILGCLPTGGGKSMAWQLPAISKAYKGTIIVVVPTVALAMDHEKSSSRFYSKIFGEENYPKAYTSDLSSREKNEVLDLLRKGKLPVLYISPEALTQKRFKELIFDLAKEEKISSLVIDEAHLVVSWGMKFRPEFQLLSAFRKQLIKMCSLKTILLSATLTPSDTQVLKNIFSSENFIEFRADQLRFEPEYFLHECSSDNSRKNIITRLVDQVPRPIILYVMTPEQGNEYKELLFDKGYSNVEVFSGKTTNEKRKNIIKKWNSDKIDIMIATSAFGMGVDKSDVRTIITGYIPESISRFYQEVGRAGRDGKSTLNYMIYNQKQDFKLVKSIKSNVISVDLLAKRWSEMIKKATRINTNEVWIDVNIPPEHLKYSHTGYQNAGWNKDIILLLYRSKLIDITDYKIKGNDYRIHIKLLDIEILENMEKLKTYIEPYRNDEKLRIEDDFQNVKRLLKKNNCYSIYFTEAFPHAADSCSGCPYCRNKGYEPYYDDSVISITSNNPIILGSTIRNDYFYSKLDLSYNDTLMITVDIESKLNTCIEILIKEGVNVIIAEKHSISLLKKLKYYNQYKYILLSLDEVDQIDLKWLSGVCALIYPEYIGDIQEYYNLSLRFKSENFMNKIIHVSNLDTFIYSENKKLNELVDKNILMSYLIEEAFYENN